MKIKSENKEVISKIINIFKPYKLKISIIILCILVSSMLSILTPVISQKLMDEGLIGKNLNVVVKYSLYGLLIVIVIQAIGIIETKYRTYIENLLLYNLEKDAFKHTLKLNLNFFSNTNYGEIMSNLRLDIRNIAQIANGNTFYIITSIFRIIVGIIGLIIINYKLAVLVVVITPIRYLIVKYLAKCRANLFGEYINSYSEYSSWYGDTIGGIREVKIWSLEDKKVGEFIKKQRNIIKQNIKMSYLAKANEISESIFTQLINTLIYIIGGYMVIGEVVTIGKIFAFITYSSYVTGPIFAIMNLGYNFSSIIPSAKRYFRFIEMISEDDYIEDHPQRVSQNDINGSIEFKNVKFSYTDRDTILKGINFNIKAGEKVAIIGNNGGGKSTIINLILRFLNPDSGEILLDGKNINSIHLKDYRKLISVVSQDVYLFNSSIKENIILNSRCKEYEMELAATKSGANKFISDMKDKYDTNVGQRGCKLSGGQRQKIAMARALIRNFRIIILDEATSNYDVESERMVNDIIKNNYIKNTVLIITHKPEILEKVDKIIVIKNGLVEDIGTNIDLYKRNKFYRDMVSGNYKEKIS